MSIPDHYQHVLEAWFADQARSKWFTVDTAFDDQIRSCFADTVVAAGAGACESWNTCADSSLALIIVLDQFPRNLYRQSAHAYAHDARARAAARHALAAGFDQQIAYERRIFFHLPFQHSEELPDQELSVELTAAWAHQREGPEQQWALEHLWWARHHHDIIQRFGRFPHRNAILGRTSTADELSFLADESRRG